MPAKPFRRKPGTWKCLSDLGSIGDDLLGFKGTVAAALFLAGVCGS